LQAITGGGVDLKNINNVKNLQKAEQGVNKDLNFNRGYLRQGQVKQTVPKNVPVKNVAFDG